MSVSFDRTRLANVTALVVLRHRARVLETTRRFQCELSGSELLSASLLSRMHIRLLLLVRRARAVYRGVHGRGSDCVWRVRYLYGLLFKDGFQIKVYTC